MPSKLQLHQLVSMFVKTVSILILIEAYRAELKILPFSIRLIHRAKTLTASLIFLASAAPLMAAPVASNATYVVSLAGVNIASVSIGFKDNGSDYEIEMGAKVSGVGTIVASGTAEAASNGHSGNGVLAALGFNLSTRSRDESFNVDVQYSSGNAIGFQIEPPLVNNVDRIAIERKDLRGVNDPLGSFIIKGASLNAELCDRRLKVFTGVERYDIAMSFAQSQTATSNRTGYQGPVILCKLRYIPVSGHFTSSEMTAYLANSDRILIWYAPLEDSGYFIPYRVLLGTSVGDLSMVLTNLS